MFSKQDEIFANNNIDSTNLRVQFDNQESGFVDKKSDLNLMLNDKENLNENSVTVNMNFNIENVFNESGAILGVQTVFELSGRCI